MRNKSQPLEIIERINNLAARVRILEDRHNTLRKRAQTIEENLIGLEKDIRKELRLLGDELLEIKQTINDLKEKLSDVSSIFQESAKSYEVVELLTYLKLLQPFKFATMKDLEKLKKA